MLAFTSMVFSVLAIHSYSPLVKVTLLAIAWALATIAVIMFINNLIEKDTITPVKHDPEPEVKIPLRDSKGRFVKGHAPTHTKK